MPETGPYSNLEQLINTLNLQLPRRTTSGRSLRLLGLTIIILSLFTGRFLGWQSELSIEYGFKSLGLLISLGAILFLFVGYKVFVAGRQREQAIKSYNVIQETRRPILYLRSFADDDPGVTIRRYLKAFYRPFYFNQVLFPPEEGLANALAPIGPMLAIGQPGEHLPNIGAVRVYSSPRGDKWKNDVSQLLQACQLIIIKAGITEGLQWEFQEVFRSTPPEKILLHVDLPKSEYQDFAQRFQEWTQIELPANPIGIMKCPFFIYFWGDFHPTAIPIKSPFVRQRMFQVNTSPFLYSLRYLFEQRSINWQKPRRNWYFLLLFALLGSIILIIVLLILLQLFI